MALLQRDYRQSVKRAMRRSWFDDVPHSHAALDDALEQGALFCNMLSDRARLGALEAQVGRTKR